MCFHCRQDKDSKEDTVKELEEIRKVIEESGGKLSNRVLHCDVRDTFDCKHDVAFYDQMYCPEII